MKKGGQTMSNRTYIKEEVMCNTKCDVSKAESNGRNSSMHVQPHRLQPLKMERLKKTGSFLFY